MLLAGRWNWWLPAWLDRALPHLNVEGSGDDEGEAAPRLTPQDTPVTEG
jgi:RND superfamily putative drug exporter